MNRAIMVLSGSEIAGLVDPASLWRSQVTAFKRYRSGAAGAQRVTAAVGRVHLTALLPGTATGIPAISAKVQTKNAQRTPAIVGTVDLFDRETGDLLAILPSASLTAVRTGLGAAIATHVLARSDARRVGLVGAGTQAAAYIAWLRFLDRIDSVVVHDSVARRADETAEALGKLEIPAEVVDSPAAVAGACDNLLLATWSRKPLMARRDIRPGTHVTSLGADEPGKCELTADLLDCGALFVDDKLLAARVLGREGVEIGDVLRAKKAGRQNAHDITVYSPVGLPMQDCVAAWHIYQRARSLAGPTTPTRSNFDAGSFTWESLLEHARLFSRLV